MFQNIIDAYNKYILLDDKIKKLEERITKLEEVQHQSSSHNKKACDVCGSGVYRPTSKPRFWNGIQTGVEWKCDNCGNVADELKSQSLSQL